MNHNHGLIRSTNVFPQMSDSLLMTPVTTDYCSWVSIRSLEIVTEATEALRNIEPG